MKPLNLNLQFAHDVLAILQEAGRLILEVYEQEDHEVERKDGGSPLTKADRLSHELILRQLSKLTPHIPIVSEEDTEETRTAERYWLVDPLDGTKEFIKRNGEFTVMAGLMHNEHPIFGAIHSPVKQIDYFGGLGVDATKIEDGLEQTIAVSRELNEPLVVVASRSHQDEKSQAFLERIGRHELTNMGSSFKFGLVAEGKADAYVRYHPTMEWDTAAGQAIVEAAGGKIISVDGDDFLYGKKGRKNGGFIVYNPQLEVESYL